MTRQDFDLIMDNINPLLVQKSKEVATAAGITLQKYYAITNRRSNGATDLARVAAAAIAVARINQK